MKVSIKGEMTLNEIEDRTRKVLYRNDQETESEKKYSLDIARLYET